VPQAPLSQLKAEASALAGDLGTLTTRARAASAAHLGSAGRRKSGMGESLWQYRRHTAEDGADRIDWRRSAREENLFVRETELETARTFLFWADPSQGFHWSSSETLPQKADRALLLCMALAGALSRSGERCGALGGGRGPVLAHARLHAWVRTFATFARTRPSRARRVIRRRWWCAVTSIRRWRTGVRVRRLSQPSAVMAFCCRCATRLKKPTRSMAACVSSARTG